MAKSKKVDYKGIKIYYDENGKLKGKEEKIDEETAESITLDVDIDLEIKEFIESLSDEERSTISIKKYKEPNKKEKEPVYKYHCKCEDSREIKSKNDYLNIHCNDCDEDFILD